MSVFTSVIYWCSCLSQSKALMLSCWHARSKSNSQRPAPAPTPSPAIFPRQLCCHGECMLFCVVAMGTRYYSRPPAPIMFLHDHLYASRTLILKKEKITLAAQRSAPWDPLYKHAQVFLMRIQRMEKIPERLLDFLTLTLHVWQRKCQMYENNFRTMASLSGFSLWSPRLCTARMPNASHWYGNNIQASVLWDNDIICFPESF